MSVISAIASLAVNDIAAAALVTTLMLKDPDGNSIAFAQAHDKTIAQ